MGERLELGELVASLLINADGSGAADDFGDDDDEAMLV